METVSKKSSAVGLCKQPRDKSVMWYIRTCKEGSNFCRENRWWLKFLCALWMFSSILHFFPRPPSLSPARDAFAPATIVVCKEDYFLTKLKTRPHTICHVPLWRFKIGMFNKLVLIVFSIFHHLWFYDSWYYFFHHLSDVRSHVSIFINLPRR